MTWNSPLSSTFLAIDSYLSFDMYSGVLSFINKKNPELFYVFSLFRLSFS